MTRRTAPGRAIPAWTWCGLFALGLPVAGCFGLIDGDGASTEASQGGQSSDDLEDCLACAKWTTSTISLSPSGELGNGDSRIPQVSGDGQHVAFCSAATNLVSDDTNNVTDVFVFDRSVGTTSRIRGLGGVEPNQVSWNVDLSGDGALVVFESLATNLVPGDTNGFSDVFLASGGEVRQLLSQTPAGEPANGNSTFPRISSDGSGVVFTSEASNLVDGDDNGVSDVFYLDLGLGQITRVSVRSDGSQGAAASEWPSISADGNTVAFVTASQLVPEDTNGVDDVYTHDRRTGVTSLPEGRVSRAGSHTPSLNSVGDQVALYSEGADWVDGDNNGVGDVFSLSLVGDAPSLDSRTYTGAVSEDGGGGPRLAGSGRALVFTSWGTDLAPQSEWYNGLGVLGVFARDLVGQKTWMVSRGTDGLRANAHASEPSISSDGSVIVYMSSATNLGADWKSSQILISAVK